MRLSVLQRVILETSYGAPTKKVSRLSVRGSSQKVITRSLERLIDKGLLVGYGVRTPQKWYIKEIRLTPLGRKAARKLNGEQTKLPI